MDIQSINNPTINTVNNSDASTIKKTSTLDKIGELNNKAVNVSVDNSFDRRSDLSNDISNYLSNISNAGSVSTNLKQQAVIIDKIQEKVAQLVQGNLTQEEVQPDVAEFISNYNASVGSINEKMQKLEDLQGDSTTYFDGAAGAIPVGVDMVHKESSRLKKELNNTLEKVSDLNASFAKKAQGVITKEIIKTQESSPFKEINFGKESANFSSTNMTNVIGSIASSQANAMQAQNIRLLT